MASAWKSWESFSSTVHLRGVLDIEVAVWSSGVPSVGLSAECAWGDWGEARGLRGECGCSTLAQEESAEEMGRKVGKRQLHSCTETAGRLKGDDRGLSPGLVKGSPLAASKRMVFKQ